MSKTTWLLIFCLLATAVTFAQAQQNQNPCILDTAKNGQAFTVRGKAVNAPHDLAFEIPGCSDAVILAYAGEPDTDVGADHLRKDSSLKRFQRYTSAVYKTSGKNLCTQCSKYGNVEATLTGKLEVATPPSGTTKDAAGFLRDSSGKVIGTLGWGHPMPFAKYRLVIESVSDVNAQKLPKPPTPDADAKGPGLDRSGPLRAGR